jgi:hypothetical protein
MSSNIIKFPKKGNPRKPTKEQVKKAEEVTTKIDIENILDHIGSEVVDHLFHYGYPADDKETTRDLLFVYDILRALLYRKHGLPHHLHNFLDQSVQTKPLADLIPDKFPDEMSDDEKREIEIEFMDEFFKKVIDANTAYDDYPSDVEPPKTKK